MDFYDTFYVGFCRFWSLTDVIIMKYYIAVCESAAWKFFKTRIQDWNLMRVSKWWQERNFSSKVVHACNLSGVLSLCWKRSYLSLANDKERVPSGTLSDNVLSITVVSLRNEIKKERQRERITDVSFFPFWSNFHTVAPSQSSSSHHEDSASVTQQAASGLQHQNKNRSPHSSNPCYWQTTMAPNANVTLRNFCWNLNV